MKQKEKVLTKAVVLELGLDKVDVITSDMLEGYTSIGYSAFEYCTSLTSIVLPNSITSIKDWAFHECTSITSISLGNSVTSIGDGAFAWCTALTSITIGNTVTSIGAMAFYGCYSLISVTIGNAVTSIGNYAFSLCSSITSIILPNSVTSIGDGAFNSCSSLVSITIHNSVLNIHQDAFYGCCKLNNIVIDDKTFEIQEIVNGKCKAYKAFNADLTCREFQYEEGKTYEIEDDPKLCERGFHACLNLLDVFNYYFGKIGKDIVVHEVELEGVSNKKNDDVSKVVAKKITIGKRIL